MFSFCKIWLCSEPSLNAGNLLIEKNKQTQLSYKATKGSTTSLHILFCFFPRPLIVSSMWWPVDKIEYYEKNDIEIESWNGLWVCVILYVLHAATIHKIIRKPL